MSNQSYQARSFVQERLLDTETGFNFWCGKLAGNDNYENIPAFTLDLGNPGVTSPTLFLGAFDISDIDQSGDAKYPVAMLYSKRSNNAPPIVTPSEFSGIVQTVVDFYLTWPTSGPPPDAESLGNLTEDAMFETFNGQEYFGLPSEFAQGLTYNGEMVADFSPVKLGGDNWIKLVRFTIQMRFFTMG